jgi:hypothetical protein
MPSSNRPSGGGDAHDAPAHRRGSERRRRPLGRTLAVATFLVIRKQSGPEWDPAKPMEEQTLWPEHAEYMDALAERGFFLFGGPGLFPRVPFAVSARSEEDVRAGLERDPWHESHLVVESVEPWAIRLRSPLLEDRL